MFLCIIPMLSSAQRHIGCSYGYDQYNRSSYFSSVGPTEIRNRTANEWGLYILRYTSDKRFIQSSLRNANSLSSNETTALVGQYVVNGQLEQIFLPAVSSSIVRYSSLDTRWGRIWGKKEMDDNFYLFHTLGVGLSRIKQITDYRFSNRALGAEARNFEYQQWGIYVTASIGAQINLYDAFSFRTELNYMIGTNNQGFVPRFGFQYRLY